MPVNPRFYSAACRRCICALAAIHASPGLAADLSDQGFRESQGIWMHLLPSLLVIVLMLLAAAVLLKHRAGSTGQPSLWKKAFGVSDQAIRVLARSHIGSNRVWLLQVDQHAKHILLVEGKNGLAMHELSDAQTPASHVTAEGEVR